MPLARKMSLLFGCAVLLTIAATLTFPWLHMTALHEQNVLGQSRRIATAVYMGLDLVGGDWESAQEQLDQRWPQVARALNVNKGVRPRLVPIHGAGPGFEQDAVQRLSRNPGQRDYWRLQRDGKEFRLAMAVRRSPLDPFPDALRGIIEVSIPVTGNEGVWNLVVTILAGASGGVLAMIAFYMIAQRLVLSPVTELRAVAEQAATGDLAARAQVHSDDEFRALSDTFNHMLARLEAAREEQARINRSLDIKLGELAETNVALYEANRLKGEFLANVSHELRTPLVSIIGFAELLRDAGPGPALDARRLHRYSENILTSGRSLLELINDLLDVAKIEAGKLELHVSDFDIAELCRDLVDFIRPLADKRNQTLDVQIAEGLPRVRSDSGRIKQILYNLLSNAVKFTPVGGSVFLRVEPADAERICMTVYDTGPGIPQALHEAVFEKFHQLDSSATREAAGTGLGLAITRDLVNILGGAIRVDTAPTGGARFVVVLPIRSERAAPQPRIHLS